MSTYNFATDRKRAIRRKLYLSQRGRCHWCDKRILLQDATLDHVMPRSKGGANHQFNLVVACRDCNGKRADDDPPGAGGEEGGGGAGQSHEQ